MAAKKKVAAKPVPKKPVAKAAMIPPVKADVKVTSVAKKGKTVEVVGMAKKKAAKKKKR